MKEEIHPSQKGITLTHTHSVRYRHLIFCQADYFLKENKTKQNKNHECKREKSTTYSMLAVLVLIVKAEEV